MLTPMVLFGASGDTYTGDTLGCREVLGSGADAPQFASQRLLDFR
jgi:hypothetical protein